MVLGRRARTAAALLGLLVALPSSGGAVPAPPRAVAYPVAQDLTVRTPPGGSAVYPLTDRPTTARFLNSRFRFTRDGVLEFDYGRGRSNAGWQFNPVSTAAYCLTAHYEYVTTGNDAARREMLRAAYGLRTRAQGSGAGLLWRYGFPGDYGAKPGWISGMAQGQAMGCLAAAGSVSGDRRLSGAAYRAFLVLVGRFGDHGTAIRVGNGVFYEEVAGGGAYPAHVLNGMIYALGGLWLANEMDPRPEYYSALFRGIRGVRSAIDSYIVPGASLYDLGPRSAAPIGSYNAVHANQLEWLASVSRDSHFLEVAMKILQFERQIPYDIRASASAPNHGVEMIRGDRGSFYAGPRRETVELTVTFARPVLVDEIRLVAWNHAWAPRTVTAIVGDEPVIDRTGGRFINLRLSPQRVSTVRLLLRAKPHMPTAIALLAFANADYRSLTAMSSVLFEHPSPAFYGNAAVPWHTSLARPWLLLDLGDAGHEVVLPLGCTARTDELEWSASPDLVSWTTPLPARPGQPVPAPASARYLLVRWIRTTACLTDLASAGSRSLLEAAPETPESDLLWPMRKV